MKMIGVDVTAEDIAAGCKLQAHACPVARALQRVLCCWSVYVSVGDERSAFIQIGDYTARIRIKCPKRVFQFATEFDLGLPVKPFSFVLVIP